MNIVGAAKCCVGAQSQKHATSETACCSSLLNLLRHIETFRFSICNPPPPPLKKNPWQRHGSCENIFLVFTPLMQTSQLPPTKTDRMGVLRKMAYPIPMLGYLELAIFLHISMKWFCWVCVYLKMLENAFLTGLESQKYLRSQVGA